MHHIIIVINIVVGSVAVDQRFSSRSDDHGMVVVMLGTSTKVVVVVMVFVLTTWTPT